jgi:hypothetical protein
MSYPSEEVWESFTSLYEQLAALSRRVRELEARLGALEQAEASRFEGNFNFGAAGSEQGGNSKSAYKGESYK